MAFREVLFPTGISIGAIGGPGFSTDVVSIRSGREQRNSAWADMRHKYEVSQAVRSAEQFKEVRAFFLASRGKLDGFLFKDPADYTVSTGEGILTVIDSTHYQLVKRYTSGSVNTDREITKPVNGTLTITGGSGHTIDYTTGILTKGTGTPTAWVGQFYVPCRFDVDELRARVAGKNAAKGLLLTWESIPIVELKEE